MGFQDVFKNSFLEGFRGMDITTGKIAATLFVTALLALYVFMIYRLVTRKVFYSKSFNISLAALSLITAAIILAMQSNLVISLGMVGALSIIRFRTAIKDPMDLVFLFWSISIGIICGAGLYEVALVTSVAVPVCILVLDVLPGGKGSDDAGSQQFRDGRRRSRTGDCQKIHKDLQGKIQKSFQRPSGHGSRTSG